MRSSCGDHIVDHMSGDAPSDVVHLVVQLRRRADPPQGRIGPAGGALQPFTGWTELAQALAVHLEVEEGRHER